MKAYKRVFNQKTSKPVQPAPKEFSPAQERRVEFIRSMVARAREET